MATRSAWPRPPMAATAPQPSRPMAPSPTPPTPISTEPTASPIRSATAMAAPTPPRSL
ncbi:hypothetical protein R2601_04573 [Salipiger bermudensis HTCC2601]|uniref:Uncharacterized protein n=1 Tax=Salipiger bermudensis (strain DSM 26914 / JCM 13377 / KCTC 12554 / HTCC2601) TaxID=314265 RepID=Q0FVT1_SALBH|nr:hypothetical protein R2601_04573 [Salipiger bermudensis HTCC2601]